MPSPSCCLALYQFKLWFCASSVRAVENAAICPYPLEIESLLSSHRGRECNHHGHKEGRAVAMAPKQAPLTTTRTPAASPRMIRRALLVARTRLAKDRPTTPISLRESRYIPPRCERQPTAPRLPADQTPATQEACRFRDPLIVQDRIGQVTGRRDIHSPKPSLFTVRSGHERGRRRLWPGNAIASLGWLQPRKRGHAMCYLRAFRTRTNPPPTAVESCVKRETLALCHRVRPTVLSPPGQPSRMFQSFRPG